MSSLPKPQFCNLNDPNTTKKVNGSFDLPSFTQNNFSHQNMHSSIHGGWLNIYCRPKKTPLWSHKK